MIIQNPDGSYTICPLAHPLARYLRELLARAQPGVRIRLLIQRRLILAAPAEAACQCCSESGC